MAFAATEVGSASAQPVELFEFVGTFNTYRLTTYGKDVTNIDGTYSAVTMSRTAVENGTQEDADLAIDIELPFDHPMVTEYVFSTAPPALTLVLYRAHLSDTDDYITMWIGKVLSWSVSGRTAKLRVPSVFSYLLSGLAPAPKYQAPCNHLLYDSRCQVDPSSFEEVTTVSSVGSDNTVVVNSQPFADADLVAGEIVSGNERRMIVSASGATLTIAFPFANLSATDAVTIRQGCDHSHPTCKTKFNNGLNFGGFPLVPPRNPFASKL